MSHRTHRRSWRTGVAAAAATLVVSGAMVVSIITAAPAAPASPTTLSIEASDAAGHSQIFLGSVPNGPVTQLTSTQDPDTLTASLAPSGSFAVFSERTDLQGAADEDIFEINTTTKAVTDLTNLPGQELYPEVSPDETRVAYYGDQQVPGATQIAIYTIDRATHATTLISSLNVATDGGPTFGANWSHAGDRLVYPVSRPSDDTSSVVIAKADGSSRTVIAAEKGAFGIGACTWSPNDQYVFCPFGGQIWAINVATGAQVQVTSVAAGLSAAESVTGDDWNMYYTVVSAHTGASHIYKLWLGDVTSSQLVFNIPGIDGVDQQPSVANSGPVLPEPPGFTTLMGGTPSPTPTPTPTVTPTPTPTPTATPTPTPTAKCPALQVFGVRGSRKDAADTSDSDDVLNAFIQKVRTKIPAAAFEPIKYPATPVGYGGLKAYGQNYVNSKFAGVKALHKRLVAFVQLCPHSYLVVVAYSQGADAALTELETFIPLYPKAAKQVLAVVTFGDPQFNPGQPKVDDGDYNKKRHGIWGELPGATLRVVPAVAVARTKSFCTTGDPVCNFNPVDLAACKLKESTCAHVKYVKRGWVELGAIWTIEKWRLRVLL